MTSPISKVYILARHGYVITMDVERLIISYGAQTADLDAVAAQECLL